jgi:hypothetical protein
MDVSTASTFQTVYDIVELATLVMDSLALSSLIALSFVNKSYFVRVHDYIRRKLRRIFSPFGLSMDIIWSILQWDSTIIGTVALKAVAPLTLPHTTRNLDIVVVRHRLDVVEGWLVQAGYGRIDSLHVPTEYAIPSQYRHSFSRMAGTTETFVNLLAVEERRHAYELCFFVSNTALMNCINQRGLFNGYRGLLTRGLAVRNHVQNMDRVSTFFDLTGPQHVANDISNDAKVEALGFTFLPINSDFHWPEHCLCIPRSTCPTEHRNMNDTTSASVPIFTVSELDTIRLRAHEGGIPICMRHRGVVWKLGEQSPEGDGEGYARKTGRF